MGIVRTGMTSQFATHLLREVFSSIPPAIHVPHASFQKVVVGNVNK